MSNAQGKRKHTPLEPMGSAIRAKPMKKMKAATASKRVRTNMSVEDQQSAGNQTRGATEMTQKRAMIEPNKDYSVTKNSIDMNDSQF